MSRGPGRLERALATVLNGEWQTMRELAAATTGTADPPRAAVESVRRACRRMVERGTVELDYLNTGHPTGGTTAHQGELWSSIGGGRSAYDPAHRPNSPSWELVARKR